jgi:hypothetical protein
LFDIQVFIFSTKEWKPGVHMTYNEIKELFPELNKTELSKLAAQHPEYMRKFPHIKIQRIN